MRNRTAGETGKIDTAIIDRLFAKEDVVLTVHLLGNECSKEYKEVITENNINFQLVPSNDHQCNVAEKIIQTFKDHFVVVLCNVDDVFAVQRLCQLLPHSEVQLNFLRRSHTQSEMPVCGHLHNKNRYDAQPFAIVVCTMKIYAMPQTAWYTWIGYQKWLHTKINLLWDREGNDGSKTTDEKLLSRRIPFFFGIFLIYKEWPNKLELPHRWMHIIKSSNTDISGASEVLQSREQLKFQEAQLLCYKNQQKLVWTHIFWKKSNTV